MHSELVSQFMPLFQLLLQFGDQVLLAFLDEARSPSFRCAQ